MEYVATSPSFVVAEPGPVWEPEPVGHILLVDDDEAIRSIAAELLRDAGYVVREADSGEAALVASAGMSAPWSLLVTDMDMPGINGIELAGQLRTRFGGLKVLVISGRDPGELRSELPDGAVMMEKPFRMSEFMARVKELIGPKR